MENIWGFYGRNTELAEVSRIISSGRWFFCAISGRRRIGKTSLLQKAAVELAEGKLFYVQIPDSDERGVIHAFREALDDFEETWGDASLGDRLLQSFIDVAAVIGILNRKGIIVVLDEFQYFHRKKLSPFTSFLQAQVDRLRDTRGGGIFVLGSIHTEMMAVLEDRTSPLFNRVTHRIQVGHWDFEALFEMWRTHEIVQPGHWLFLWSLFEGVPKFYQDCFEQRLLGQTDDYRQTTILRLFFEGASPLRDEAANWFLNELRGRYDSVLKLLARMGPCSLGQLRNEYTQVGGGDELSAYLRVLVDRFGMVEKLQPISAIPKMRRGRYVISDNFLSAWLNAIGRNVQMARVQPVHKPLARTDMMLATHEGTVFEKMIRQLTEESSQKGVGDFELTDLIRGYWNKPDGSDIEIDLVAINEDQRKIRFGSCKRNADSHSGSERKNFAEHVHRFLGETKEGRKFNDWQVEKVLYAPDFAPSIRSGLEEKGWMCRDLADFQQRLYPN